MILYDDKKMSKIDTPSCSIVHISEHCGPTVTASIRQATWWQQFEAE